MVRSIGRDTVAERTARDAAVVGSGVKTTGICEAVGCSSRSVATGAVGAGAGAVGASHSHRRQWHTGASACVGVVGNLPGRSAGALSPQQDDLVPVPPTEAGVQQV